MRAFELCQEEEGPGEVRLKRSCRPSAGIGAERENSESTLPRGTMMGLIYTCVDLINPRNRSLKPISAKALVDTGAITLCIPEHVVVQLGLEELEKREVKTADGEPRLVPYVGPIQVRFGNRSCFTGALVLGDSVLLGAVPMEDMDLVINPRTQELTVNPDSPNIPSAIVMRLSRL